MPLRLSSFQAAANLHSKDVPKARYPRATHLKEAMGEGCKRKVVQKPAFVDRLVWETCIFYGTFCEEVVLQVGKVPFFKFDSLEDLQGQQEQKNAKHAVTASNFDDVWKSL